MTNNDQKSSVKNEFQDLINEANDYFYNTDYENNYVKAFELFIKAYEIDPANVQVLNRLADIYFYGLSGEKNTEKAFELYTQSSKLGSFEGFCGVLTYFGDMYGEDSNEKFFEFCKNMYEENPSNLEAGFQTALCYLDSIGTKKDEEYAVGLLNELVEKGCINAADVLADIYYEGSEVTCQDIKRALQLYKFAADNNNAHAQTCLGISYKDGKGVEADIKKSIEYFESAVAQNDRVAMYHLAMIYANGNGVSKDYDKAIELLTKSSDLGYSSASVQLGLLYQYGQGVEKDGKKAFELYNYAYNNGNTNIALMEFIGKCYKDGIGTDVNYEKALEFLSIASDRGEALAKYELATM